LRNREIPRWVFQGAAEPTSAIFADPYQINRPARCNQE